MTFLDDVLSRPDPFYTIDENGAERWADMNKGVTPVFYMEPVENPAKSKEAGRPIFDEVETVRIFVAGDPLSQHTAPVDDHYRERFAEPYRKWKESNRTRQQISGTPLREWSLLTPARVKELEAIGIFNVEGLAAVAETNLQRTQGLRELRDKAAAWLQNAKDSAFAVKIAGENQELRDEVAELKKQMAELMADRASDSGSRGRKQA